MTAAEAERAVTVQGAALLRALSDAAARLPSGFVGGMLARGLWLVLLGNLRRIEAGARRVVAIAAAGIEVPEVAAGQAAEPAPHRARGKQRKGRRGFRYDDPRIDPEAGLKPPHTKRKNPDGPRIGVIGVDEFIAAPETDTAPEEVDAAALLERMRVVGAVLSDVAGHAARLARRIARQRARFEAAREAGLRAVPPRLPMRPGNPPGYRRRRGARGPLDALLWECHVLAWRAWNEREPP